jgi:prepilin signal peptidase PulO-like enzyme (type II secretory pathway)
MRITKEQNREFGMVMVLITTFIAFYLKKYAYIKIAFALTLITLLFPVLFYPVAICWFGMGRSLGKISSGILLSLVFIVVVVPIGLFRKITGYDSLKLKQFKKTRKSVMQERNHIYADEDLLHTF